MNRSSVAAWIALAVLTRSSVAPSFEPEARSMSGTVCEEWVLDLARDAADPTLYCPDAS